LGEAGFVEREGLTGKGEEAEECDGDQQEEEVIREGGP
jgi:hypothetical protein